jgi:hypothetical protein
VDPFSLTIAVLSSDEALRSELARVCRTRGHVLAEVDRLRDLRAVCDPDILVLDLEGGPDAALSVALGVRTVHPDATVVLVGDASERRTMGDLPVIDRWRAGERLGDALEAAYVGIPSSIAELYLADG